jgi:hypothetical protein
MVSEEWIDRQIVFLNSRLGIYKLDSENFFFEPTGGFYGFIAQGDVKPLNEAMRMLADHLYSLSAPIIENWEGSTDFLATTDHDYSSDKEAPGFITYDGPHRSRIKIGFVNKHSPFVMGAILAHELTHHFLFNKDIGYPDVNENERFTDFATVYLGLGKLTLNGYEHISWTIGQGENKRKYIYKIGYLSQKDMAAIMKKICIFRKIPISLAQSNLTDISSQMLIKEFYEIIKVSCYDGIKESLSKFIGKIFGRKYKSTRNDIPKKDYEDFIVIRCVFCENKLRMPVVNFNLRITCPICRSKFIMHPKVKN